MSELGNKNFLQEQMTSSSVSAFKDDEYYSMQNYAAPTPSKSVASSTSVYSQPMTGKGSVSVASQGYKPKSPTTQRGLDVSIPFDINAFDPGNIDTYPQEWEDYAEWFAEWWTPRNYDLYRSFVTLAGTNSISGLGGSFGGLGQGGPDPEIEFLQFLEQIFVQSASPPLFDENGNNIGGYCLNCYDFGGGGVTPKPKPGAIENDGYVSLG